LASGRIGKFGLDLSPENAELTRDVLSALAHELGGIASALDLRAAAMSRTIPDQDVTALRDIVEEVRMSTRAARFARGPEGSGVLSPARHQTLAEWWRLTSRFSSSVLPRGVAVEAQLSEGQLNAPQSSALTWIWLAACKEIAERGIVPPCTIMIRADPGTESGKGVTLVAELNSDRLSSPDGTSSRWLKYATKHAKELGVTPPSWEQDGAVTRWKCQLIA